MKKIIFSTFMALFYFQTLFAASPCSTGFALGYANAAQVYFIQKKFCEEKDISPEWCMFEVQKNYANTFTNLVTQFNSCCCLHEYTECCN